MKKLHLLAFLSVAIVAAGFMLTQSTKAENLTLQVTAMAGAGCTGGNALDVGSVASSYSAQALTGTISGSFVCTGSAVATGTFTIAATVPVGPNSVAATSVKAVTTGTYSATQGDSLCLVATALDAGRTNISGSAQNVIYRNNLGYPCTLTNTAVAVEVVIPANAPVGAYTGSLTFTQGGTW